MLTTITKLSATKAYTFFAILRIKGCEYNRHSTNDLTPSIPIAVDTIIIVAIMIYLTVLCLNFDVRIHVKLVATAITIFPNDHPGIPRNPLVRRQYNITPKNPTNILLPTPNE